MLRDLPLRAEHIDRPELVEETATEQGFPRGMGVPPMSEAQGLRNISIADLLLLPHR
jgi:hypothetical protein